MIANKSFGNTCDGQQATLYTLLSPTVEVDVTDYGATVVAIRTLDKFGRMDDVIAGFSNITGYERNSALIGCREEGIKSSTTLINGNVQKKLWKTEIDGNRSITFHHWCTDDGDSLQAGVVHNYIKYKLINSELQVQHMALSSKDIDVDLTSKIYFNLSGHKCWRTMKNQLVTVYSDSFKDAFGVTRSVANTSFDIRKPTFFSSEYLQELQQTRLKGRVHCYHLSSTHDRKLLSRIKNVINGRMMNIETTQPDVTVDGANEFDEIEGKYGVKYSKHSCVAITPNNSNPGESSQITHLKAGESFGCSTWFTFSYTL